VHSTGYGGGADPQQRTVDGGGGAGRGGTGVTAKGDH